MATAYRGSNEYDISVLEDQPPSISIERPGRDKKATNLEEVLTQARAEDDYGVVSMDLHFSVNGGEEKKGQPAGPDPGISAHPDRRLHFLS